MFVHEEALNTIFTLGQTRAQLAQFDFAGFTDPEGLVEEGVDSAFLALARCLVEDSFEGLVALQAVGEVAALDAEVEGAGPTLVIGWVEEVVEEFVASHTTLVPALKAEDKRTFLEE